MFQNQEPDLVSNGFDWSAIDPIDEYVISVFSNHSKSIGELNRAESLNDVRRAPRESG